MITDLEIITEGIKIQFDKEEEMSFEETRLFTEGGFTRFAISVTYRIAGAYLENREIHVIVIVKRFTCDERVSDFAIDSFERRVKRIIEMKIPETAEACMKILMVRKEVSPTTTSNK